MKHEGMWEHRQNCVEQIKEADYTLHKIDEEIKLYNAKIAHLLRMREDIEISIQGTLEYVKSLSSEIIITGNKK